MFDNFLKPVIENMTTEKVGIFHFRFVRAILTQWKEQNKALYNQFVTKLDVPIISKILQNASELHKLEQKEVLTLLETIVDPKETKEKPDNRHSELKAEFAKFVEKELNNFLVLRSRVSTIAFVLHLARVYLSDSDSRSKVLRQLIHLVTEDICVK